MAHAAERHMALSYDEEIVLTCTGGKTKSRAHPDFSRSNCPREADL